MSAPLRQIYRERPATPSRPSRRPVLVSVDSSVAEPARAVTRSTLPDLAPNVDAEVVQIITAPNLGETAELAFRRKERELGTLFARLSVAECRALHARLSNPRAGDQVATHFGRLVVERRGRLLAFLADARRREALRKQA